MKVLAANRWATPTMLGGAGFSWVDLNCEVTFVVPATGKVQIVLSSSAGEGLRVASDLGYRLPAFHAPGSARDRHRSAAETSFDFAEYGLSPGSTVTLRLTAFINDGANANDSINKALNLLVIG